MPRRWKRRLYYFNELLFWGIGLLGLLVFVSALAGFIWANLQNA